MIKTDVQSRYKQNITMSSEKNQNNIYLQNNTKVSNKIAIDRYKKKKVSEKEVLKLTTDLIRKCDNCDIAISYRC